LTDLRIVTIYSVETIVKRTESSGVNRVCHADNGNDAFGRLVRIQIIQPDASEIKTLEGEASQAQCPDFDE
jgi:hypothetical protein